MWTIVSWLLAVAALLLAIPIAVLLVEVVAAVTARSVMIADASGQIHRDEATNQARPHVAVLVPAHDESVGMLPTLSDIRAQLHPSDRMLVVADNCTDDTAAVAASAGAEVVQRADLSRIGKGYALDFGLRHLAAEAPAIVVVIDADCRLEEGALDRLVVACEVTQRPVQALYLMSAPSCAATSFHIAEFAWRVKNWVRPLALATLGLPCQLMGSGMAFPWDLIRSANLASAEIVEDLMLGLDLAYAGSAPVFLPAARVRSTFPTAAVSAERQRQRWEHGHLRAIAAAFPRLLLAGLARRDAGLIALALDLAVPPLALLGLAAGGLVVVTGAAALLGLSPIPLLVSAASLTALLLTVALAWLQFGQDTLSARALFGVGCYLLGKLRLYARLLTHGFVSQWSRTDRT